MQFENQLPGSGTSDGLWPVRIRILFVVDGRIGLSKGIDFGLGYVLDALRASWSWWVGFEVDVATREQSMGDLFRGGYTVKYSGFKFDPAFDIDRYDQIWFFGDRPNGGGDGNDSTTDADILPPYTLEDDELRKIAAWMDRGGGVFATGDHNVLGATSCNRQCTGRSAARLSVCMCRSSCHTSTS